MSQESQRREAERLEHLRAEALARVITGTCSLLRGHPFLDADAKHVILEAMSLYLDNRDPSADDPPWVASMREALEAAGRAVPASRGRIQ